MKIQSIATECSQNLLNDATVQISENEIHFTVNTNSYLRVVKKSLKFKPDTAKASLTRKKNHILISVSMVKLCVTMFNLIQVVHASLHNQAFTKVCNYELKAIATEFQV